MSVSEAFDNDKNMRTDGGKPYLIWQNYNYYSCGDPVDADCDDAREDYWGCDNNGTTEGGQTWEAGWTRNHIIDEIRINEYATGQGAHYCAVAPPIVAKKVTINYPTESQSGLATTFDVTYDAYDVSRTDAQSCFSASKMEIEIDENGGDWGDLAYDSGQISYAVSPHEVSGLLDNTNYQLRKRHSSTARGIEYWGEWSDTRHFTTGQYRGSKLSTGVLIDIGGILVIE